MIRKFFAALSVFASVSMSLTSAQSVTVEGMGLDRDSATRDAVRIAVEQVVGTYLQADTLVKDLIVELDEIYKKSQGYVKSVKVLEESQVNNQYRVRALVDVDTNPNGTLMNELAMLYNLNDPRIVVIVFQNDGVEGTQHNRTAETFMNEKLLSMGFSHVSDAAHVIRINDARILNEIYENRAPLNDIAEKDTAIDYLVLGRLDSYYDAMQVPNVREGGMIATGMNGARANLTCKVIKYDTGTLVGTFQTEGSGLDGVSNRATELAIRSASTAAAEALGKTFRRFGSITTEKVQFTVRTGDYDRIDQLRRDLLNTNGVQNVHLREYRNGKTVLDVESTHKANVLIQLLRQRTNLGLFIESVSNNTIQLSIT